MNNQSFKTKQGICQFPLAYSYCKSQAKQELVGYVLVLDKKFVGCETCYQNSKEIQWARNYQYGEIHVNWFYFYDEKRQQIEDKAQLADYYQKKSQNSQSE